MFFAIKSYNSINVECLNYSNCGFFSEKKSYFLNRFLRPIPCDKQLDSESQLTETTGCYNIGDCDRCLCDTVIIVCFPLTSESQRPYMYIMLKYVELILICRLGSCSKLAIFMQCEYYINFIFLELQE